MLKKYAVELYDDGYEKGLNDAWDAVMKIFDMKADTSEAVFGKLFTQDIVRNYTATEAIAKIKEYEQEQKAKSTSAEDVMRQYLNEFCTGRTCSECVLYTPDFTCGRGCHFLSYNPVSDEEVRKAYFTVLKRKNE